jgi:hypothetical protein
MTLKPYSVNALSAAGLILGAMGLYFMFIRPPLLPEDLHYMGTSMQTVKQHLPMLPAWLQKVFWVLGGHLFTTGLLTVFMSRTSFRTRSPGVFTVTLLAGLSSIGWMTIVNFIIGSDFMWLLLSFTVPWVVALVLYRLRI